MESKNTVIVEYQPEVKDFLKVVSGGLALVLPSQVKIDPGRTYKLKVITARCLQGC